MFRTLSEAYSILSNLTERRLYNIHLGDYNDYKSYGDNFKEYLSSVRRFQVTQVSKAIRKDRQHSLLRLCRQVREFINAGDSSVFQEALSQQFSQCEALLPPN